MALTEKEVLEQSKAAMKQWKAIWDEHCLKNGALYKEIGKKHKELLYMGMGKTLICVATGPSVEKHIETISNRNKSAVDVACVDKCLGMLVENGIIPDYTYIADAGVDFKRWCEPYLDKIKGKHLVSNINGNPEWAKAWHKAGGYVWFYTNKDNIQSELKYAPMSGCREVIPASSNVGNSVVVFSAQLLGYDKYLLVGYDYCWGDDENYYAYNDGDKRHWMKHLQMIDYKGRIVNTSQNLLFSARWLSEFVQNNLSGKGFNIINCSEQGILQLPRSILKKEMAIAKHRPMNERDRENVFKSVSEQIQITTEDVAKNPNALIEAINAVDVSNVVINYIPKWALKFFQEPITA